MLVFCFLSVQIVLGLVLFRCFVLAFACLYCLIVAALFGMHGFVFALSCFVIFRSVGVVLVFCFVFVSAVFCLLCKVQSFCVLF